MAFEGIAARIVAASLSAGLATGAVAVGVTRLADDRGGAATVSATAPRGNTGSASAEATPSGAAGQLAADGQETSAAAVLNPAGGVLRLPDGSVLGTPSTSDLQRVAGRTTGAARSIVSGAQSGIPTSPGAGDIPSTPTAPAVPAVPAVPVVPTPELDASPSASGSYTLLVPGTPGVAKKLCVSGDISSRCVTVSVGPLQSTVVTVAYAGNASTDLPTYSVVPCTGGLALTVGALAPGASVTVSANGKSVTRQVAADERSQTASLCDA